MERCDPGRTKSALQKPGCVAVLSFFRKNEPAQEGLAIQKTPDRKGMIRTTADMGIRGRAPGFIEHASGCGRNRRQPIVRGNMPIS
jgi:hypothetical protein